MNLAKFSSVKTVNIHQAKTTLSALLRLVEEEGESIRIARNGRPVAQIVPIAKNKDPLLVFNPKLQGRCLGDPMVPLDPEDWPDTKWPEPK